MASVSLCRKRDSYSFKQKLDVVFLANQIGRNKAAQQHDLDATMVGRWMKKYGNFDFDIFALDNKNSKRIGSGRYKLFVEEENVLYQWVIQLRNNGLAVNYTALKLKMKELVEASIVDTEDFNKKEVARNFKASSCWLQGFLKRRDLSLCRKTKISQRMPEDLQDKLLNFQRYIIHLREKNEYPLNYIANMDETPVFFDMAGDLTVNPTGSKTVHIRTTGNEKNRFTVVLTCFANGSKFPPIIIFKGKSWPKNSPPPPSGVQVWFQDNGWMDEANMMKYFRYWSIKHSDNFQKC